MKSFQDDQGRAWTPAVNVERCRAMRDRLDVSLPDFDRGLFERLAGDPILLVDVLYLLCEPQCQQKNVSDVDFARALAGDSLDEAVTAFLENLCLFFPSRRRGPLQTLLAKLRALEERTCQQANERMSGPKVERILQQEANRAIDELDRRIDELLADSGSSSGDTPASSDSTPVPTRSAS